MEISYQVITPIALEPITLSDAKAYARVDYSDEDNTIAELISDARQYAEDLTKRSLAVQTIQAIIQPPLLPETFAGPITGPIDAWVAAERPNIPLFGNSAMLLRIPRPPLISMTTIEYQLTRMDNPEWQTLAATDTNGNPNYRIDTIADPQELSIFSILAASRYRLTYTAGYSMLPFPLRRALLSLVAFWYDNRNGEPPDTLDRQFLRYRVMSL